jgi:very-short-patch-repair endonuclease
MHGALSWTALRERVDRRTVMRRIASGMLEQLSPRVLRVAGAPSTHEQRIAAATLDVAGGAVASFETAAWLWGLPGFILRTIEVTALRSQHRTSTLAFVHRPVKLLPHHITVVRGIPVTTLARTLFDLAGVLHPKRTARLVDTVCTRSEATKVQLHKLVRELAGRGKPGSTLMRELMAKRPVGIRVPSSGYEARFEEVMADAGITGLRRQVDVGGHSWIGRVDYVDDVTGGLIEIDSETHHSSPTDRAADAERDAAAIEAGFTYVLRIPTEDVYPRPHLVVAAVLAMRSRYPTAPDVVGSGTENGPEGAEAG